MSGHISGDKIVVFETRRRWADEERRRALDDTLTASVSSVARQHGIAKNLTMAKFDVSNDTGKIVTVATHLMKWLPHQPA